jgi:pimeloyl-ACP methyl ester carboxylesterase
VYAIDGPSHGNSEGVHRDFTFDECVTAAVQALDGLGLAEPVDWVGNAWGGHVGIRLAAAERPRVRTLITIGTPIQAFDWKEKLAQAWPLVQAYRLTGPSAFITRLLFDRLIGADAVAAEPDQAAVIMDSFRSADRDAMFHAMRSMMLHRSGIEDLLERVAVPTMVMSVRDDVTGWRPDEARATCAAIADCRVEEVAGSGHVSPLLVDRARVAHLVREFWTSVKCRADKT